MEKIVNLPFPNSDGQRNIDSGMLKALKVLYVDALKYSKVYIVQYNYTRKIEYF